MSKEDSGAKSPVTPEATQPQLPAKDPVAEAVAKVHPKADTMVFVTERLIDSSYREYGTLALQEANLKESLGKIQTRMEEVRQHVAALQSALNQNQQLNRPGKH